MPATIDITRIALGAQADGSAFGRVFAHLLERGQRSDTPAPGLARAAADGLRALEAGDDLAVATALLHAGVLLGLLTEEREQARMQRELAQKGGRARRKPENVVGAAITRYRELRGSGEKIEMIDDILQQELGISLKTVQRHLKR